MDYRESHTRFVKEKARELGFFYCGISKADLLEEEVPRFESYLSKGYHGEMKYLENHFDKRMDPRKLVEDSKSVVSLLFNYYPEKTLNEESSFQISKYAYGEDYHFVVKEKLKVFLQAIQEEIGEVGGRFFVDSAPVLDKAWAARSGVGWIGKHSNLITKKQGSFFFIAELILDLELVADGPVKDYCGSCTRCIDACPTDAIVSDKVVDGSRCISYLTIELKKEIPLEFKGKMNDWIFGCDICQDVCPWNRFSIEHGVQAFNASDELLAFSRDAWMDLTENTFSDLFKKSAVKRTGYKGLMRNIMFLDA